MLDIDLPRIKDDRKLEVDINTNPPIPEQWGTAFVIGNSSVQSIGCNFIDIKWNHREELLDVGGSQVTIYNSQMN